MGNKFQQLLSVIILLNLCISSFSQSNSSGIEQADSIIDSLISNGIILKRDRSAPEIKLSVSDAVKLLEKTYRQENWNNQADPLRQAFGQLIFEATHPRFDSSAHFLKNYPFDSISIPWDKFYLWEPVTLKIPVFSSSRLPDSSGRIVLADSGSAGIISRPDSLIISPLKEYDPTNSDMPGVILADTTIMVMIDTLHYVESEYPGFPFHSFSSPYQGDSIRVAVNSLLNYIEGRDSTIIKLTGIDNSDVPIWLNSRSDMMIRYWLKNEFDDSVTVWIGTPSRNTLGLYLEKGVNFRRPVKQNNYSDARIDLKSIDNTKLLEVQRIIVRVQYWKYRSEASFVLNQASLTNWVKGGESSISTSMDVTGYADYINKPLKLSSNNFIRLKLGFLASGDKGVRKNLDLLETNSKLNHKAFGKFDFSAVMLFKTQVAKGYNYPNDSIPVSKFINPAILTIGLGLDYKPNKTTSINFSPFSYKGTFVPDTANIDQTKYGIANDRKSKNEPGASVMISNEYKPFKKVTVTNRLQLFTNYINNPQNVDIDWEMIVVANLNWFTDVRFNTHLIFDDDTKTTVLDKENKPVLGPDGFPKKSARIQFKEMLGFSFVFKF